MKLTEILNENHTPEQVGFRSGFSATNYPQAISQVMEKAGAFYLKSYMVLIDCS
jgi:hypothetical protein